VERKFDCDQTSLRYDICRLATEVERKFDCDQTSLRYDICRLATEPASNDPGVFGCKYPEPHLSILDIYSKHQPRIVNSDPRSEATIGLVKDWLSACRSHRECKTQKPRPLPTRVIDIRTHNPTIIESEGLNGLYVALSHCWGSTDDTFSTTTKNIKQRRTFGLEVSQLPLNFQHAIAFTRRLGYDYLWIDSLCILQQDLQDWQHEAGRMAGYYNNAIVTLAIADAINSQFGFLHHRHHQHSPRIRGEDGEFYYLREVLPGQHHLYVSSCISKRAWTLQERILSPRVIHFTRDQLWWRCRKVQWAEGYIYNASILSEEFRCDRAGYFIDRTEHDAYRRDRTSDSTKKLILDADFAAQMWSDCVSEFSTRSLTRASDKLAAIAGLATMFCQPELGQYLAGLWEADLFRGMAWKRVEPSERTTCPYKSYIAIKAKRNLVARDYQINSDYRAPSWSWASLNVPVEVDAEMFLPVQLGSFEAMRYEADHWEKRCGPRLVSCNLIHGSNNSYVDTLEGSFIEVRGFYRKLWVSKARLSLEADGPDGSFIKTALFDNDMPEQIYTYLSQPDQLNQLWKELLMFQICKQLQGTRLVYALLLEKLQDPDSFKRVGLVGLACHNLCKIPEKQSHSGSRYNMHPIHKGWLKDVRKHYQTKEWHRDRWTEGTLKLF
jgi:hypothetical protein